MTSYREAARRKRSAEAELKELELEERRGRLLSRERVVRSLRTIVVTARDRLRGIPARAGLELGLGREQRTKLLALIDVVLTDLGNVPLPGTEDSA